MKRYFPKLFGLAFLILVPATAPSQETIPFVPSPMLVVERMLQLADIKKDDVVYDMGSGDGRILIRAAKKFGARGVGIDLNPEIGEIAKSGLENYFITIVHGRSPRR